MTARAADTASPPPFISSVSKNGRLGMWYAMLISPLTRSPGLKSAYLYGPVPTGLMLFGASRDLPPLYASNRCFGMIMPRLPQKASDQNGVGFWKVIFIVWLSILSMRVMSLYELIVVAAVAG